MKIKTPVYIFILMAIFALLLAGCAAVDSSNFKDSRAVNDQQKVYQVAQPVPFFQWSQERDSFIQLYRLRNEALTTYTVLQTSMDSQPFFGCASKGFPLAGDYQLTNPVAPYYVSGTSYSDITVDQAEPNGLFSSKNTVATWVLCTNKEGEVYPVYSEQSASTFPFPVKWDKELGMLVPAIDDLNPSATITIQGK